MNSSTRYEWLTSLRRDKSFDAAASTAILATHFEANPIVQIQTLGNRYFFLRRHFGEGDENFMVYRVFADPDSAAASENEVGYCQLRQPENGIVTIADAQVNDAFQKKGIASAVYDCIVKDLESAGAILWPVSPTKMGDAEFKVWWRRAPALVFYYPHRERLGFEPRHEFEELLNNEGVSGAVAEKPDSPGFWSRLRTIGQRLGRKSSRVVD